MKIEVVVKRNRIITFVLLAIIGLCILSSRITDFNSIKGLESIPEALLWMITNFVPEASSFSKLPDIIKKLVETIFLSVAATTVAAVFALFFVSFGILTRAFIETIDESSSDAIEALEASGASYSQIVFQAVIPSSMSQMISWILYMIETNIRSSTLIGILTGTGIGFIFDLYYKNMNYGVASLVVITIVIAVFFIELISNNVRRVIL